MLRFAMHVESSVLLLDLWTPLHVLDFVIGNMQQANLECCRSMIPLVVISNQCCHGVNIQRIQEEVPLSLIESIPREELKLKTIDIT